MAAKPFASGHILAAADVNDLVGIIDRSTSTVTVASTVTETSLYSKSIAANSLSTDRMLRLILMGTHLVNTGSGSTATFRVKFGATTVIADGVFFFDDADHRPWVIEVLLANKGATNSQFVMLKLLHHQNAFTPATTGLGTLEILGQAAGSAETTGHVSGTATEDTTAAKTLDVTVQHSGSSANASISKLYGLLTLS